MATLGAKTTVIESSDVAKATVAFKDADKSAIVITSKAAGEATITAKETADATDSATIKVVVASDGKITATVTKKIGEGQTPTPDPTPTPTPTPTPAGGDTVDTTVSFLTPITPGSATEASKEGFFAGTKKGDLDVTVSAVELQLYKKDTGWTPIAASSSSTKAGKAGDMMEGPDYISGQLETKGDAVANADATVLGEKGYEMGRVKLTVTAGAKPVNIKSLSGYFASGKAFTVGYVKVGEAAYTKIEYDDSAKLTKSSGSQTGFVAKNFAVGKAIAAGASADVYILLGKVADSAPSAGVTIEVAELVLTMAEDSALASIAATTTKSEYAVNEDFDASKITVTATYANGKTATVTGWTSNADTAFNKTTAGSYTITITYKEGEVTKTCELPVTVKAKALTSIAVKTNPTKTEYTQGDTALDLAGLVITLTYDDNTTDEVAYSDTTKDSFATSGFDSSAAAESQAITVTYGGKTTTFNVVIKAKVYFKSFVAGTDTGKTADSSDYETITSTDGLVTMGRSKYQLNEWSTRDYNAETGAGYTYTARVKVNKASGSDKGELTIKNVKIGDVLRFDGGNSGSGDRKMAITGADETVWTASASSFGSFYLTATAETVVLTSADNEFCIYGIHVVPAKVATTVVSEETTYSKPTVVLSAASVAKDTEVTVTTTVPQSVTKKTYSDGKIEEVKADVTAEITYTGATVANGKVDTSTPGTLTITASYKIGETTYTSDAVSLEVASGFTPATVNVTNNEATLGLVATEGNVSSSAPAVATAAISGENIVITSVAAGTATITAGNGTNSATIEVTVAASGAITHTVKKYSAFNPIILDWSVDTTKTDTTTFTKNVAATWKGVNVIALANNVTETSSGLSIANCRFDIGSTSSTATAASDTSVTGDIAFVDGYDIKVTITYTSALAEGKSSGALQVFLDNNTGSATKSVLGNDSKLANAGTVPSTETKTLVNTIDCSAIITAYAAKTGVSVNGHYIAIRADSGCVATVTAVKIEYVAKN